MILRTSGLVLPVLVLLSGASVAADEAAERGYRLLLSKPYVPPYFDEETFDQTWRVWPEPLRSQARDATPRQRRRMAFRRYGLTLRPGDTSGKPLQFVVDEAGNWVPNCFTCHGGKVRGRVIPGLPNSHYALQTLIEETRLVKAGLSARSTADQAQRHVARLDFAGLFEQARRFPATLNRRFQPIDAGSLLIPLGGSNGTTNAVNFGVALGAYRDEDLNVLDAALPPMLHHDMDAPPWWHFRKKSMLYIDGFAEKGHRGLMQFALDRQNGPERFREWESDFRDIFAYLESIEPPAYPFPVDHDLASRGQQVFERACARCHGTYGESADYPHRIVPIDEIGTDRARHDALTREHRESYARNWFSHYGEQRVIVDPGGFMAPPLDGIWASAPYLHNGSIPTLWHLLHPDQRPHVWKRTEDGYDNGRVGLTFTEYDELPATIMHGWQRRQYFDTRRFGKSNAGHHYPDVLSNAEKRQVLEYLKTL